MKKGVFFPLEPKERNKAIQSYIQSRFAAESKHIQFARENSQSHGIKNIHVPSHIGKLLYILTKIHKPKKILEIGTLSGYSALWMAEGLPIDGKIISLELKPENATLAKEHIKIAGFENQIEIRVGNAPILLQEMIANSEGPFDLIFIDADKENYPKYLELAILLSKPGTLILSDNLIPKSGDVSNPSPLDRVACSLHEFNTHLSEHPRLESILSTTIVGEKTRIDALGISIVK